VQGAQAQHGPFVIDVGAVGQQLLDQGHVTRGDRAFDVRRLRGGGSQENGGLEGLDEMFIAYSCVCA